MKLGISYMVFDGWELLESAILSIRQEIDFISVTYQDISYFGNPVDPLLLPTLQKLQKQNLVDEIIYYHTDLSIHHKENEVNLRNLGLKASKNAGCSHHISADVDEFYVANQLKYAKEVMSQEDYDFSVVPILTYYKQPTYLVYPIQKLLVSFIHPVSVVYDKNVNYPKFPFHMETTRRFNKYDRYRLFTQEEIVIHHMSYVRNDIRKKFANSDNAQFYKLEKFIHTFENYKLGQKICLLPDYINRRTIEAPNQFNIKLFD